MPEARRAIAAIDITDPAREMREKCAMVAEGITGEFAGAKIPGSDEAEEAWHSGVSYAAWNVAAAIRALPVPEGGSLNRCTCMEVHGEDPQCPKHGHGTEWAKENPEGDA